MLGRDHALLGAVGFLAIAPALVPGMTWEEIGVGTVTSAAFALLPDIDEPGSTVSRKLGLISQTLSGGIRSVAGGHREATHSLFFAAIVGVLCYFANGHDWAMAIIIGAGFMLALRMILPKVLRFSIPLFILPFVGAYWVYHHPLLPTKVLLLATAGGVIWHLVGDSLTVEGVPWFWLPLVPRLKDVRIAVPLVGHCGSERETFLGILMSLGVLWFALRLVGVPAYHSAIMEWNRHANFGFVNNILHRAKTGVTNTVHNGVKSQITNVKKGIVKSAP
jgi:membrane-bound metal-dependent hydrolase YbcI (DUF457 family)